ncbi:MAG: hypothetical protein KI790_08810 [Cyclobacteriaceae bacterium]|nr:hypothetical protein [Cyclobacteriaceae bacterium HetDA_MAG_MS6]
MDLNIDELKTGLASTLKDSLNADLPAIKEYGEKIIEEEKETLETLGQLLLSGQITADEMKSQLEDEKVTIENQVRAIQVMSTVALQNATNAVIKFLQDAVVKAVQAAI